MFNLRQRIVLVTGGGSGIGKTIAKQFYLSGANVIITGRDEKKLVSSVKEIEKETVNLDKNTIKYKVFDHSCVGKSAELARIIEQELGKIEILVNNAGYSAALMPIDKVSYEEYTRTFITNLYSPIELIKSVVPGMKTRRYGRIINISSRYGMKGVAERSLYSASKAAIIGLTKSLAIELADYNINVNCIAPGPIKTELTRQQWSKVKEQSFSSSIPLNRWGTPEEIAPAVLLLASEEGSYITGTTITIDGGGNA